MQKLATDEHHQWNKIGPEIDKVYRESGLDVGIYKELLEILQENTTLASLHLNPVFYTEFKELNVLLERNKLILDEQRTKRIKVAPLEENTLEVGTKRKMTLPLDDEPENKQIKLE